MKRRTRQRQKPFISFVGEKVKNLQEKKRMDQLEQAKQGMLIVDETKEQLEAQKQAIEDEFQKNFDVFDRGVIDVNGGKRQKIHEHFEHFLKDKYFETDSEMLSFDDFYIMSEQFFQYRGLPVLFRDILYNLLGYFYAVSDNPDETLDFYTRMIKDNQHYIKKKKSIKFYLDKGCKPEAIDYAQYICPEESDSEK